MDNFEMVKDRLPVPAVVGRYNAEMVRNFAEPSPCCGHKGCCSVGSDGRVWKCFACGKGGSVIDLIMAVEGVDEGEALRRGADMARVELKGPERQKEQAKPREGAQERMYRLAAEHYRAAMTEGSPGWEWFCNSRGHKPETLVKLRVGWSTGSLVQFLTEHGYTPADVVRYGLASDTVKRKDGDGKEVKKSVPPFDFYPAGLAIFPVVNHDGKVISFTAKDPAKKRNASMPRGTVKKWFINYPALGRYDELFVVEGENDVASLMDAGFDNVIGTAGAPGLEQVKLLRNFCAGKTLYLWFDKDADRNPMKNEGGPHHTRFIYQNLRGNNVDVKVIAHPGEAKDPDDYIRGGFAA